MTFTKPVKIILIVLGVFTGFLLVYIYYNINPNGQSYIPKCPFHTLTGLHCPGCGSQRAIHDFLHGNFLQGLSHNLLIGLTALTVIYKLFLIVRKRYYPHKSSDLFYHPKTAWFVLTLILLFWILRNIPYEPFIRLAP